MDASVPVREAIRADHHVERLIPASHDEGSDLDNLGDGSAKVRSRVGDVVKVVDIVRPSRLGGGGKRVVGVRRSTYGGLLRVGRTREREELRSFYLDLVCSPQSRNGPRES